ncbi:MAG: AAA-ATPase-like protein [Candidatus Magnetoglobus multicellularis str. Araruama]|uniref:AAA-ATPase-like protein n=1 Tax=Candidatus Magnetoglobus multicellularis str. Araruama TaxID=890399 RepID=A0A1V1NY77_9BACT|nr:MAG: AAA-ATPase-like protein [Candidatus Magnetoglobus multicellularis str. Araruama]
MKNSYAISDFEKLRLSGFQYIDRTDRIPKIESVGQYLLFLRPRRFGKSLWLSTLKNYYDVAKKDAFDALFSDLWIGKNPTSLANQYFVLKWDFSCVECSGSNADIRRSLFNHINSIIKMFEVDYAHILKSKIEIDPDFAMNSFFSLLSCIKQTPHKLYLFIDEYDNFANELMARRKEDKYFDMTGLDGFLKTFFKSLKSATEGMGLDRMFLTGVTPILLNDVTSGDNIKTDIHILPDFSDLCGFTETEVRSLIQSFTHSLETNPRYQSIDFSKLFPQGKEQWMEELFSLIKNLYDGYSFSPYIIKHIYNPTLIMYLFKQLEQLYGQLPKTLLDHNLLADSGRIEYIANLPGGTELIMELNQNKTIEIIEIESRFGFKDMIEKTSKTQVFMGSYLYYMGVLTLGETVPSGKQQLKIPNPVTQSLYIDSIVKWIVKDPGQRDIGFQEAEQLTREGKMAPLRNYIESQVFPSFDWRDKRWVNELTIKTIFMCLMNDNVNYLMISERQTRTGYADLAMIVRPDRRSFSIKDILIEFKYIKTKTLSVKNLKKQSDKSLFALKPIQNKLKQARSQAKKYAKELKDEFGDVMQLNTYAVIAIGFERLLYKKL